MEKNGGSRLLQMQARFQQKQLQEREMKIASLYEAQQARALDRVRHSPSNGINGVSSPPQPPPVSVHPGKEREQKIASLYESQQARALDRVRHSPSNGVSPASSPPQEPPISKNPGKVRQMFEERRTKAGIDKSYPLQPIHNTDRPARKALPNGFAKVATTITNRISEKKSVKTHMTSSHSVKKQQHKVDNIVNGSGDLNHNHESDLNSVKNQIPQSNGEVIHSIDELDKADNNYLLENETFPDALAPTPTPRSPDPEPVPKRPQRRSPPPKTSQVKPKPAPAPASPRKSTSDTNAAAADSKARGGMQRTQPVPPRRQQVSSSSKPRPAGGAGGVSAGAPSSAGSGAPCAVCGRRFAPDRLAKHQEICKKSHSKKRKPFDVLKHRLAGTEAEPFINKVRKTVANPSSNKVKTLNSNWRQKHEEFIAAIRAAKQVQAHLNAGGKLSDLPPPPPSENPDYVQCPHCSRRFNQSAAERHIPKCASYQFNKPKPAAKRR